MNVEFVLEAPSYGWELMCPRCRSNNLHHEKVTVFTRPEGEDQDVIAMGVEGRQVSVHAYSADDPINPSSRRDGLVIDFWCENCDCDENEGGIFQHLELTIVQHKGTTYFNWRGPIPRAMPGSST